MAENEELINTNKHISDEVQALEQSLKTNQVRGAEREKKLQKDLDIAKRRIADSKREVEYLTTQINKLREERSRQTQQTGQQSGGSANRGRIAVA